MIELTVKSIEKSECKIWCLKKHYAKRLPPIEHAFGLFQNDIIVGIVTFGTPVSSTLRDLWKGKYKLKELNRLVVNEGLPKNSLSFFVASALKLLPKPLVIVSYADTSMNHNGYIYQATNWIYTGLSAEFKDIRIKGLEHLHHSTIDDKVRQYVNKRERLREIYGDRIYYEDRPRKHRYFYFIGNKREIKDMNKMLPYKIESYPKGENSRYDNTYRIKEQGMLF